jgi:CRP-like cAMP-binding protein
MTIEDDIAFLERIPTFRRLGAPALRILAIGAEGYRVEQGQVLFAAGDTADAAYAIQQGSFALRPGRGAGTDADVIAGPGALLGESALLAETIRPATATARESSAVLRISRAMFLKMLEGYPDAAHRLREVIAARADQWAREMESVRAALAPRPKPE